MSEFLESEIVQEELGDISKMLEKIYEKIFYYGSMSRDGKLECIDMLTTLLDKQKIMYTRLSLSDDPKAIEMKENLRKSVVMMGFPPETDMQFLFNSMHATIQSLRDYVDA